MLEHRNSNPDAMQKDYSIHVRQRTSWQFIYFAWNAVIQFAYALSVCGPFLAKYNVQLFAAPS